MYSLNISYLILFFYLCLDLILPNFHVNKNFNFFVILNSVLSKQNGSPVRVKFANVRQFSSLFTSNIEAKNLN